MGYFSLKLKKQLHEFAMTIIPKSTATHQTA